MLKSDRVKINYTLTFHTPFHCGTGIRAGLIDRTVTRNREGYLYVPGSTIKGATRELCEQLARLYSPGREARQRIASPHDTDAVVHEWGKTPTMITRIFGSHLSPGHLCFNHASQSNEARHQYDQVGGPVEERKGKYKSLQVDTYTQVRIDRLTRTATRGALYTSEFGIRNLIFEGSISGWLECTSTEQSSHERNSDSDDSPTYSLLLLIAGLQMLERLGGNKSTGKGQCSCEIKTIKINGTVYKEKQWMDWLEHLSTLTKYPQS